MKNKNAHWSKTLISDQLKKYQFNLGPDRLAILAGIALKIAGDRVFKQGLKPILDDIVCLGGMLRDGLSGRFKIPRARLLQIGAALAYVFCPTDLVADIIPVVGQMDDVAVVAFVARSIEEIIAAYRAVTEVA